MMKEGMDTKAVVTTMMIRSMILLRRRAATAPSTTPHASAHPAAITPSLTDTFMPSMMMVDTCWPRCLMEGPKSRWRISFR